MSCLPTRRDFFSGSLAALAMLSIDTPLSAQSSAGARATPVIPSEDTVLKFHRDGSMKPFAGNTVICHLPAQCRTRDALTDFHQALATSTFSSKLGLTAPDSYHMTIYSGVNDQKRTDWPSYVSRTAPMSECDRLVGDHMEETRLKCKLPFRVALDEEATVNTPTACTMRMKGASPEEELKLRSVRDQLAIAYGFRRADHERYGFHITVSYQVAPFSDKEERQYRSLLREHVRCIVQAQPVLEFGNPEFCTFPDMNRFEPRKFIRCV